MYRCKKTDCLMRSAERSMRGSLRCGNCEPARTDASPFIVYVSQPDPTPTRREEESSSRSSYNSDSSSSSSSSSSDSGSSFSGGGGDAGGGGSSDSF